MITEIATITIDPARAEDFEAAIAKASAVIRAAEGSHSMMVERVIETPGKYLLRVEWDSVEHHMVTFRESPAFKDWRAFVGSFFLGTPTVEHSMLVGKFF
ncbi:antibiotic biosynthesis monooxygenase family protein [Sphingomonas sp. MMS24-J13]|uniref:antibiotic biosynthesis monooxygenase family protein n=1 Tax=Sphingomonas sp. MMS24-J13 TaxID=3238686 RepID=UPI00384A5D10